MLVWSRTAVAVRGAIARYLLDASTNSGLMHHVGDWKADLTSLKALRGYVVL